MKRLFRFASAAAAALIAVSMLTQAEEEKPRRLNTRVFMRVKLASCQQVLEGLVTHDAALIEKGAEEMAEMSEASDWPRADDECYEHYGVEFRRLCGRLSELAKEKNFAGASFAYSQLTASCITCHDHVRNSLQVTRDPSSPFQLIPTVPSDPKPN